MIIKHTLDTLLGERHPIVLWSAERDGGGFLEEIHHGQWRFLNPLQPGNNSLSTIIDVHGLIVPLQAGNSCLCTIVNHVSEIFKYYWKGRKSFTKNYFSKLSIFLLPNIGIFIFTLLV